ncbi:alpha/beta hydrolase [Sphingomonas sp.]|uniref:alpha/beta hydrolase n=1 Tax=Sphingomonas sp. TaxID=28214 RepID=UPI0035C87A7A
MRRIVPMLVSVLAPQPRGVPPPLSRAEELAYGPAPLQRLDFYPPLDGSAPVPLVVFVHGGGWSRGDKGRTTGYTKANHILRRGLAFASLNYRLVPLATVEQQAQDVADALALLFREASARGVDPRRIVLMGHSAGAHLAALVVTDRAYARHAGIDPQRLAGTILLDGAAYDVARQSAGGLPFVSGLYGAAFGRDPERHARLSPTLHAETTTGRFLILWVQRPSAAEQSQGLAQALRRGGAQVETHAIPHRGLRGHLQLNRALGDPAHPATAIVDRWIDGVLA